MEPGKKAGLVWGTVLGFVLTVLGRFLPSGARRFVPSAGVVGLGFIFQWWMCLMMFLGALASEGWKLWKKENHDEFMVPVASGLFIGAPLIAAAITFIVNGEEIVRSLGDSFRMMLN